MIFWLIQVFKKGKKDWPLTLKNFRSYKVSQEVPGVPI